MMGKVVAFRPKERVLQDSGPIALMYRNMGTAAAEQVVTRALGEVAMSMAELSERSHSRDRPDLSRRLRRLQHMAEGLGMVSLGRVAGDLRDCLDHADPASMAALWARLMRVAECSLAPDRGWLDQRP